MWFKKKPNANGMAERDSKVIVRVSEVYVSLVPAKEENRD